MQRISLFALACLCLFPGSFRLLADPSDIDNYYEQKSNNYTQTDISAPTYFESIWQAGVNPLNATSVTTPSVTPPSSGTTYMMYNAGGNFWQTPFAGFSSQAAMDAAYPNGGYQFNIPTTSGSALTYTPTLVEADNFPAQVPILSNTNWVGGSLYFDYSLGDTLTWNANTDSNVQLHVYGSLGDSFTGAGLLSGSTSYTIAPGQLVSGETYTAYLEFQNYTVDSTQIPGVVGQVSDYTITVFTIAPEPSSICLAFIGVSFVVVLARRRFSVHSR